MSPKARWFIYSFLHYSFSFSLLINILISDIFPYEISEIGPLQLQGFFLFKFFQRQEFLNRKQFINAGCLL